MPSNKKLQKNSKAPKKPSWHVWINKKDNAVYSTCEKNDKVLPSNRWNPQTGKYDSIPPLYSLEDFEPKNPQEFVLSTTLKFEKIWHGSSSCYISFEDLQTKHSYRMFLKRFNQMLEDVTMDKGHVTGNWKFESKSGYMGIYLERECELDDDDDEENDDE